MAIIEQGGYICGTCKKFINVFTHVKQDVYECCDCVEERKEKAIRSIELEAGCTRAMAEYLYKFRREIIELLTPHSY